MHLLSFIIVLNWLQWTPKREFRDLALKLFQDMDAPAHEPYENPNTFQAIDKVATKSNPHNDLLQSLVDGQAQINKTLESMMLKQEQRDNLLHE